MIHQFENNLKFINIYNKMYPNTYYDSKDIFGKIYVDLRIFFGTNIIRHIKNHISENNL